MIQEFRNLQMEHESNLSEISAKHEHAIAMMKRKHDAHIRTLESKHLKYVSKMSDTKDTKLNDLEKRLSKIVTKRVEPRVMKWYVYHSLILIEIVNTRTQVRTYQGKTCGATISLSGTFRYGDSSRGSNEFCATMLRHGTSTSSETS